jgi:cytochrome c oxidase subunit 3
MSEPSSALLEPPAPTRPSAGAGGRGGDAGGRDGGGRGGDGGGGGEPGAGALPFSNERLLLLLALIASTMLFTGLIGAFLVLRISSHPWPPPGSPPLPAGLAINTVVIVASSVALAVAHLAQRRGRPRPTRLFLLLATAGAIAFLALQARCWRTLVSAGVVPETDNFAGFFYLLTLAHFAHAAVGLVFLLHASAKAVRGFPARQLALPVDLAALFWHFVDMAWIGIYVVIRS